MKVILRGNVKVHYQVPLSPGTASGDAGMVSPGTLGGQPTTSIDEGGNDLPEPGDYVISISPAPVRPCVIHVR